MSIQENKIPIADYQHTDFQIQPFNVDIEFKHTSDKLVFEFLLKSGNTGKTREQICSELNMPRSSVFDSLTRLTIAKMIEIDFKKPKNKKGRPLTLYFLKNYNQGRNR